MMVEEEQISFRSGSLMVDGVEDYTHQIAEMIGLPSESNFIESGVSAILFTVWEPSVCLFELAFADQGKKL